FQNIYGGFGNLGIANTSNPLQDTNYMALSVQAFFNNGGSELYVSRVFAPTSPTDTGLAASGTPAAGNVVVTAMFPGAYLNNQTVTATLNAVKTQTVSGLPTGSLLAVAPAALGTLKTAVNASATTITLNAALPAGEQHPASVQVDSEVMTVTNVDATNTILTVTRAASATAHAVGAQVYLAPVTFTYYWNGTGSTFTNASGQALTLPASGTLYVLTLSVTAPGAAGSSLVYNNLGFDPAHPNYLGSTLGQTPPRHIDALQNQIWLNIGSTLKPPTAQNPVALFNGFFPTPAFPLTGNSQTFTLTGGDDGTQPLSTDFANALANFTALEDVAIVAAPGSGIFDDSQNIINALIMHVSQQRAYRIAILETPPNQLASDNENVRSQIDSSYAALYVPWVVTPNPLAVTGNPAIPAAIAVPPSGFMAGIYARNDEDSGVAKAPANEVVLGATRFERNISFAEQAALNPLGINCLRYFPNRGNLVWGARTATSNTEFMYVNVRRYLIYLEHSIDNSTQWAVFENNGPALWARVTESIDSFLYNEWKEGSLLGDSASQAYFVRCDRTTMTQNDLDNGRMICLIGVAVLKPAEFVIFRIGQMTAGTES
ncbi:MAG TPA: phage tail sheath subtilisin-like domain-containing protein, partial [Xanthobacteraceae bacterium]|nr:phage tail sheath subtilisin-like domain-containing protein [Xanthobacteraceae bacterium]